MNPFNVGDEVRMKRDRTFVNTEGVITSISLCGVYLRFKGQKYGYDYRSYELVTQAQIMSYEEML